MTGSDPVTQVLDVPGARLYYVTGGWSPTGLAWACAGVSAGGPAGP
jgi:hypothetical protein